MCLSAYYFHAPLVCIRLTRILLKLTAISIVTAAGSRRIHPLRFASVNIKTYDYVSNLYERKGQDDTEHIMMMLAYGIQWSYEFTI